MAQIGAEQDLRKLHHWPHFGKTKGDGIKVQNWENSAIANFASFMAYANARQITSLSALAIATKRLPIGVEWDCGRYVKASDELV